MARELFIYYRIPAAAAHAARDAVRAMQARLRERHPGLTARLLRRPDEPNDLQTWMEIYAFHRDDEVSGVSPSLETEIAAEARVLEPFISGTRHTEVFVPCAS